MLEFTNIDLYKIGGKCGLRDHQWATLELRLRETENDHGRGVEITLLVPRRPDATMSELEEAARSEAIAILEASLEQLRGSSVAELRAREYTAEDAERARLDRQLSNLANPQPPSQ